MPPKKIEGILASEIATKVGGTLIGDTAAKVTSLSALDDATEGALVFVREKSAARLKAALISSNASVILTETSLAASDLPSHKAIIVHPHPYKALVSCIPLFFDSYSPGPGIHPMSAIDPSAKLQRNVSVGAFVSIGAFAEIGEDAVIHPHVTIYPGAKIGARSLIHSGAVIREDCELGADTVIQNGAVIGGDGFGFIPDPKFGLLPVPQVGIVKLADRVEVGANSCIDKATLGKTIIGAGTKIDNLVQIGHNTHIGQHSILCGQVGIAGSCKIGNGVVFGGNVGIGDHVEIADGVRLAAKSGVTGNLLEKGDYAGHPAIPAMAWRRAMATLTKLPEITKQQRKEKE